MRSKKEPTLTKLRAREIIRVLKIKHPSEISIEDIAWTQGMLVREDFLEGSDGRLIIQGKRGIVTVKKNIPEPGRKRFVAAHELGHFEMHKNQNIVTSCSDRDMLFWQHTHNEEADANDFAVEILMPQDLFEPKCDKKKPTISFIEELSEEFQTTLTATALRYIEFTPERCALIISEDKKIKWFRITEDFGFWFERGAKLDPDSYAYDFFSDGDIPMEPQKVPATAWLSNKELWCYQIQEHSKPLPRYNSVLTLLWIYQDM